MSDASSSHAGDFTPIALAEIDASCRLPLFLMFVSAAAWLVIGSAFAIISTLTFHQPNLFANCAALTYGRARPAYFNSILYGFCLQAGLGVALLMVIGGIVFFKVRGRGRVRRKSEEKSDEKEHVLKYVELPSSVN